MAMVQLERIIIELVQLARRTTVLVQRKFGKFEQAQHSFELELKNNLQRGLRNFELAHNWVLRSFRQVRKRYQDCRLQGYKLEHRLEHSLEHI